MHFVVAPHTSFAGDLIGFTTALLITVVLLVLTLRAAKLPGTPVANIVFAVCALVWSAGGLATSAFRASGINNHDHMALAAAALQFTAAAAFPIPILALWRPFAIRNWQKTAARALEVAASISAAIFAILLWTTAFGALNLVSIQNVKLATAYNAAIFLLVGAVLLLRRESTRRSIFLASLAIVAAVCVASLVMTLARNSRPDTDLKTWLAAVWTHLVLLVVLCAFFLFARFRFADVFIRYGVRILLAGLCASIVALAAESSLLLHIARHAHSPPAVHVFAVLLIAFTFLLSFTFVDERISRAVNRLLFRTPDYRTATRRLGDGLRQLSQEGEIAAAVESAASETLELSGAQLVAVAEHPSCNWPPALLDGEVAEVDPADSLPLPRSEVLVPVTTGGKVTHALLVSPGLARPGLVMNDLNYLRTIAGQCGNRLDAVHRERESVERQSRETLLQQQVTEAELQALRAQINPHFLFNSLNTMAELIVRDPARAETMTLRLASVFRHVLAHSSRPLTSIREEIEFLRTYLYIEEARFGDRLHVDINIDPELAREMIPSLILQPLVENALKHGLAPKLGPGQLWISAHKATGDQIRLAVEDDGIGIGTRTSRRIHGKPDAGNGAESPGLGLQNVARRLRTLYQDRASVSLEPREAGGSRVIVLIPRGGINSAV